MAFERCLDSLRLVNTSLLPASISIGLESEREPPLSEARSGDMCHLKRVHRFR